MRFTKRILVLFIGFLFFIAGCQSQSAVDMQEIVLPVGYIPSVQFAPYYVAIANGYYEEAGLQVELQYGYEIDGVSLVGAGEYPFAVASGEQVVLARDKGLPIKYVMNWYKDYPVGIAALEDSGISSLPDLEGKTVGIPALQGASYIAYKGFESINEFDAALVDLQVIGYTQPEMLSQGEVDAAVIYMANTPVVLTAQGYSVVAFPISDYVALVGNGIVTNETTIASQPELIEAFTTATMQGITYAAAHPEETYEICKDFVPNLDEELFQYEVLTASIPFWNSTGGLSDVDAWQTTVELVQSLDMLTNTVEFDGLFTNEFVD